MDELKWIAEATVQIYEHKQSLKYLKSCGPDDYQQDKFFKLEDFIKCCEKQIKFLEEGIRLIQEKDE